MSWFSDKITSDASRVIGQHGYGLFIEKIINAVLVIASVVLFGLHDDNVFIADDLYKKCTLFSLILETIILRVVVELDTQQETHYAHEYLATVRYDRNQ